MWGVALRTNVRAKPSFLRTTNLVSSSAVSAAAIAKPPAASTLITSSLRLNPTRSFASFSPFNGRGAKEAPRTAERANSFLLHRIDTGFFKSPRYALRISPWTGKDHDRTAANESDTIASDWETKAHDRVTAADGPAPRHIHVLPLESQRTKWILSLKQTLRFTGTKPSYQRVLPLPKKIKTTLRRILEIVISVLGLAWFAEFYSSHLEIIPIVNRRHFVAVSESIEHQIGDFLCQQLLEEHDEIDDPLDPRLQLVIRVGERIAAAAHKPNWKWEFHLIDDDTVNALCFPGGKIVVFTGLLDVIYKREEAYLAKMKLLGLKPIGHLSEKELEAIQKTEVMHPRRESWWSSATGNVVIPAAAWPWPERPPLEPAEAGRGNSFAAQLQELFAGNANKTSDSATLNLQDQHAAAASNNHGGHASTALEKAHPHDVDSRGLKVDRGLLSNHLAVVLGHEVAHAIARHSAEHFTWYAPIFIMTLVNNASPLLQVFYDMLFALPFSRLQESEADELGLTLMARACFHPGAAASFWADFSGAPEATRYFSTHPPDKQRERDAARWYPQAKMEMKRCCRGAN